MKKETDLDETLAKIKCSQKAYLGQPCGPSGQHINIAKALNGFIIMISGESIVYQDLEEVQHFLEKYYA